MGNAHSKGCDHHILEGKDIGNTEKVGEDTVGQRGTKEPVLGGTYDNGKEVFYSEDGERKGVPSCTSTSAIQLLVLTGAVMNKTRTDWIRILRSKILLILHRPLYQTKLMVETNTPVDTLILLV